MANAILVADDDPDILSIVSMSLETQGYTVYKATNGREAVDLAREHHPDLILMDIQLPEVSMGTTYTLFNAVSGRESQRVWASAARCTAMPTSGPHSRATTVRVSSPSGRHSSSAAAAVAPTQPSE